MANNNSYPPSAGAPPPLPRQPRNLVRTETLQKAPQPQVSVPLILPVFHLGICYSFSVRSFLKDQQLYPHKCDSRWEWWGEPGLPSLHVIWAPKCGLACLPGVVPAPGFHVASREELVLGGGSSHWPEIPRHASSPSYNDDGSCRQGLPLVVAGHASVSTIPGAHLWALRVLLTHVGTV